MIDKININSTQPILDSEATQKQEAKKASSDINMDASINLDNAALLDSAIQNTTTSADTLEQAKKALLSGRLDSIDNITEAAGNIIKFGI